MLNSNNIIWKAKTLLMASLRPMNSPTDSHLRSASSLSIAANSTRSGWSTSTLPTFCCCCCWASSACTAKRRSIFFLRDLATSCAECQHSCKTPTAMRKRMCAHANACPAHDRRGKHRGNGDRSFCNAQRTLLSASAMSLQQPGPQKCCHSSTDATSPFKTVSQINLLVPPAFEVSGGHIAATISCRQRRTASDGRPT